MNEINWKQQLLLRWCEEHPPANKDSQFVKLITSTEIARDLSGFGDITADEITAQLIGSYEIEFEFGYPNWRIIDKNQQLIVIDKE